MRARLIVEAPGEIAFTAKLTMSLKQWMELRDQLAHKWPSSQLSSVITDMVVRAQRSFYADVDEDEDDPASPPPGEPVKPGGET